VSGCVFCDIVSGAVNAHIVYSDDSTLAFLDRAPLRAGHTLVVPRTHLETLNDLSADALAPFFTVVQRVAKAAEDAMHADGCFVAINIRISQSVPHLHVHVVPRNKGDGLFSKNFMWIRRPYPRPDEAAEAQRKIKAALG
jgi:histidine triad (HIT) family protein